MGKKIARKRRSITGSSSPTRFKQLGALFLATVCTWIFVDRFNRFRNLLQNSNLDALFLNNNKAATTDTAANARFGGATTRPLSIPQKEQKEDNLPNDWNEVLRLRAQSLQQQQQQQQIQERAAVKEYAAPALPQNSVPIADFMQSLGGNTDKDIILAAKDALYQKGTWDKSPIVIEEYKLVFFTVPKVGCTAFKQLFRRMMGYENWQDHQYYNEPFLPHNPYKNGLKYLSHFDFNKANEMLTSNEWTRAIFVRDPKERVLSAFLDKAVYSQGYYLRMRCCEKFATGSEQWSKLQCATGVKQYTKPQPGEVAVEIMPFEDFLQQIIPQCPDPHWETQATRMAPKYWQRINFVGRFETIYEDTKTLLTKIGAWEKYGATGWTTKDGKDGAMFDPTQQAVHGTKAQSQSSKDRYFTPNALYYIQQYYAMDYNHDVLKFTRPVMA